MSETSADSVNKLLLDFQDFPLKLKLTEKLVLPLCKGKYFRFQIKLVNNSAIEIPKTVKFPLVVRIFTACKPHKEVKASMNGEEILKGSTKGTLVFSCISDMHLAQFKLLINDVSSHFSGFDLIIEAKDNDFCKKNGLFIKPVIIKGVTVMSKEKICKKIRGDFGFAVRGPTETESETKRN